MRKTQRGCARAAQRLILSLTARPGNGEGTCWTQRRSGAGRAKRTTTPVPWNGSRAFGSFHLLGYAV